MNDNNEVKRWTAKRKAALVKDIIRGKTNASEAARGFDLKLEEGVQQPYSGRSFRVGKALDLFAAGMSIEQIMIKGGWQTVPSALTYLRNSPS